MEHSNSSGPIERQAAPEPGNTPAPAAFSSLQLHIGELVLDGFPEMNRGLLAQAVQVELSRLFSEGGVPPGLLSGEALPRLDAGSFEVAPGSGVDSLEARTAASLAASLYWSLWS